jgi:hypothetical protein
MNRIFSALAVGLMLVAVPHPGETAEAAIVKTTITISTPAHIYASVANPVDVQVCSKATLSATVCESVSERSVTLWANNTKIQTLKTVGGGGVASFNWTPKTSGKITLKATVSAASSALRAATSESKKVTVKARTKATTINVLACAASCKAGLPSVIDLAGDGVLFAGITSGTTKGRKVRIQTLRVTNKYEDESSASATWQSDVNKYGIAVSYGSLDPYSNCTPGSTQNWNYRFYVDATSNSPAAATKAKWIDVVCPAEEVAEDVALDFTYLDQDIDSLFESPELAYVSISAPSSSQYSVWTEYCYKDTDCTEIDNWYFIEGYFDSDQIFGSREFVLSMDPETTGEFWVRVFVIPWTTDQEMFTSDWYSLTIN